VTREDVDRVRASLEQAAAAGAFFANGNMIAVAGRTP
jgi:hypothetical protein